MIVAIGIALADRHPARHLDGALDRGPSASLRGFLDTAQVMPVFVYLGVLVRAVRHPVPAGGARHRHLRRAAGRAAHQRTGCAACRW